MTFGAFWSVAMYCVVTFPATDIGMSTYVLRNFPFLACVAGAAILGKKLKINQAGDGSVRICMAGEALRERRAMYFTVTTGALRYNFGPVSTRPEGVENRMAFTAVYLMSATLIPDIFEH